MYLGSRNRLTERSMDHYAGTTLFDRVARAVCRASCLPRKELYESWEVAKRVRRRFRGGRVVDLASGHGLLAHMLLLLDDTSPSAFAVDRRIPKNALHLSGVLCETWPRLRDRVIYHEGSIADFTCSSSDLLVCVHGCGALTDEVLDKAILCKAPVAVLPCCHALGKSDDGGFTPWLGGPLAVDVARAGRLKEAGFHIRTQHIPAEITPKNRLLMARPPS